MSCIGRDNLVPHEKHLARARANAQNWEGELLRARVKVYRIEKKHWRVQDVDESDGKRESSVSTSAAWSASAKSSHKSRKYCIFERKYRTCVPPHLLHLPQLQHPLLNLAQGSRHLDAAGSEVLILQEARDHIEGSSGVLVVVDGVAVEDGQHG
jgi:hypothetical protein